MKRPARASKPPVKLEPHAFVVLGLWALGVAACAPAPPRGAPVELPVPRPPATLATVPPEVPFAAEPLTVASVACRYEDARVLYPIEQGLRLCDATGGACFFETYDRHLLHVRDVILGAGEPPTLLVEATYEGMIVRGFVPLSDGAAFSARRRPLGSHALPERLVLRRAEADRVEVEADLGAPVAPRTIRGSVACGDIQFDSSWRSLEELAQVGGATGAEEAKMLPRAGAALYAAPRARDPVLRFEPGDEAPYVYAYQSEGSRRFVFAYLDNGGVFGWVDRSALGDPVNLGTSWGSSGGGHVSIGTSDPARAIACDHDVSVFARVGERWLEAGRFPAKAPLSLDEPVSRTLVAIRLRHPHAYPSEDPSDVRPRPSARLLPGAVLAVLTKDLERCAPVAVPRPR